MQSIKNIARLNDLELANAIPPSASWHTDYRDTSHVHFSGLNPDLSEGDALVIFSQYGEPVWIRLARDRDTGKSRGFGWLKYEDQRSTDLAVDNLSGAEVLGKRLAVDHARYKPGKDEDPREGFVGKEIEGEEEEGEERAVLKEEVELKRLEERAGGEEEDPMKRYLVERKREEVRDALAKAEKGERRHKHRHRHRERDGDGREQRRKKSRSRSPAPRRRERSRS